MNLQKLAHTRNTGEDGKPKKPYTRIPLWWLGLISMISGEFSNLLAYGYAPTSLVAPVGAVGVFFNALIATVIMKEPFRRRDAVGLGGEQLRLFRPELRLREDALVVEGLRVAERLHAGRLHGGASRRSARSR